MIRRIRARDMHYCFLLTFGLKHPASLRMQQLGAELIRRGIDVSYILTDDGVAPADPLLRDRARFEWIAPGSFLKAMLARRRALRRLRPDFVEVLNPHIQTLVPLIGLRNLRVVALWDEPLFLHDISPGARIASYLWNRWLLARAWLKIVASRQLQVLLHESYRVDATYLPHVTYLRPPLDDGPSPFDQSTVVYLGTLFPVWDHDLIFAAARELARRGESASICVIGTGPDLERWRSYLRENQLTRVSMTGFLSESEMWRHMRHAHALLFPMRPTLLNRSRCSSKLLAYAQARRPVIGNKVGEAPQILGEHLPIWVEPTPQAFADAIARITAAPPPPDVDYDLGRLSPQTRASELLEAIRRRSDP